MRSNPSRAMLFRLLAPPHVHGISELHFGDGDARIVRGKPTDMECPLYTEALMEVGGSALTASRSPWARGRAEHVDGEESGAEERGRVIVLGMVVTRGDEGRIASS
jgi:hypothetical protein